MKSSLRMGVVCLTLLVGIGAAQAQDVTVTIENLAPANGTFQTPFWIGFHDGSFDLFDAGSAASSGLESLAEDGSTASVSSAFGAAVPGGLDATLTAPGGTPDAPVFSPGESASMSYTIPTPSANRYFSFASMVIPSNDAFIGNDSPTSIELFDGAGNFKGPVTLTILGSMVYDAGTEVNDELPANTAFFGQAGPNTGINESGLVGLHGGFLAAGNGGILDDAMFANADFTAGGYEVARITITPEPGTMALLGLGSMALLRRRRQRV